MHRIIGILLGGLTIYLLLNVMDAFTKDTQPRYLFAIVIGMLVALLWPWVIGIFVARRARDRRDEQIQKEVDRQIAEQNKG